MTANTPSDYETKMGLLEDVFTILDPERILTGFEEQIGGFDLICKGKGDGHCNAVLLDASETVLSGVMFRILRQPGTLVVLHIVIAATDEEKRQRGHARKVIDFLEQLLRRVARQGERMVLVTQSCRSHASLASQGFTSC